MLNLADPYLKASRAKEHLDALRKELDVFYQSKIKIRAKDDIKNQRVRIFPQIVDVPDRVSVVVGDVFYNMRASLDQMVWSLAALTLAYPDGTQFPILEQRDDGRFDKQTRGIPTEARTIIESLQPYHGQDTASIRSHLLWRLNKMCIIDKHRRIPHHSAVLDFKMPESIYREMRVENGGVMSIPLAMKDALKSYMNLDPEVSFHVVFGDSHEGIQCTVEEIETIHHFVANNVIPRFMRFFP